MSAALVWNVLGEHDPTIEWDRARVFTPWLISQSYTREEAGKIRAGIRIEEEIYKNLNWHNGWAESYHKYPPDIYAFEIHLSRSYLLDRPVEVIFRYQFYTQLFTYVKFTASLEIGMALQKFIRRNNCIAPLFGFKGMDEQLKIKDAEPMFIIKEGRFLLKGW